MDPILAIVVIVAVAIVVWALHLPGIVLGATVALCLLAVVLPYARGRRGPR